MSDKVVTQLRSGKFELSLPHCELRQCGESDGYKYAGAGFVSQDSDGRIILRMISSEQLEQGEMFDRVFRPRNDPGVLISDDHYYDLDAVDHRGRTWTARRLHIDEDFGRGVEIRAVLSRLESAGEATAKDGKSTKWWFIPQQITLPWHAWSETTPHRSVDAFEHQDDSFAWNVRKVDDGIEVEFTAERVALEPHAERFIRALSILSGQVLEPIASIVVSDGNLTTSISPRKARNVGKLPTPLEPRIHAEEDAHRLVSHCIRNAEQTHPSPVDQFSVIYAFWHRLARAHIDDVENSSLVLSVAIEGVIKAAFQSEHDGDRSFGDLADAAHAAIHKLDLDPRLLDSITASLSQASKPKIQSVLRRLQDMGAISSIHLRSWKNLRNSSAHGEMLDDDVVRLQRHLDRYFCCLDLFYRLLFVAVGYRGMHIDMSLKKWPSAQFPSRPMSLSETPESQS